jgi:hypothetical protein
MISCFSGLYKTIKRGTLSELLLLLLGIGAERSKRHLAKGAVLTATPAATSKPKVYELSQEMALRAGGALGEMTGQDSEKR